MTGAGTTQQSTPEDQTSSPPTAAPNTSNASNAPRSAAAVGAHTFRTDLTHEWWTHGGGTSLGDSHMSGGFHSNAPQSQNQDQSHTHAASSSDNNDRNDTAGKLPQSFDSTAQHLADIGSSTSRSMTAAEHGEGFVRPGTSGSGFSDPIDTDASSLPSARVNSLGPPSRTPDEDADEAIVEQAIRESFEIITRGQLSDEQKRALLLNAASKLESRSQRHPQIATVLDRATSSIKDTKPRNLGKKLPDMAKKLSDIKKHIVRLFGPGGAFPAADGSRKRKTSSALDIEEHEQPSTKKSRPSGVSRKREKSESDVQEDGPPAKKGKHRHSLTYADTIVIINDDLGLASDLARQSESFYKDALVVSTDGSFSAESRHAGAGAAWQALETDDENSNPVDMDWYGISWPLGRAIDGELNPPAYAERMAIKLALHMIVRGSMLEGRQQVVIQIDSRSCLRQIENGLLAGGARDSNINDIVAYIDQLVSSEVDVKLIWVKGHHLCTGNRLADKYASSGRILSETGIAPITSLEVDSVSQAKVRKYAARLPEMTCKKATCDAGTQTEPTTDWNHVPGPESLQQNLVAPNNVTHIQQASPDSDMLNDDLTANADQDMMDTTTIPDGRQPDVGSSENENARAATADSEQLDAVQQSDRVNHTGATFYLARYNLAYEEPFMRDELRAAWYEDLDAHINSLREEGLWDICD
ncbi:hypothetical protein KC354_g7060 [Hortaea werneckii]|nr:hypothetical protein KC354_g7060 [Hortaea werneckii]